MKTIAVLCDYELLPDRVGGMDYFFWLFDKKCKANTIDIHWFFPNKSTHEGYSNLTIFESNYANVENYFLENFKSNHYDFIFTHFVELCIPFFKKIKKISNSKIIAVDHNPRPIEGYTLKKRIAKRLKGYLYSDYIDVFIAVSPYSLSQLLVDFGNKIKSKSKVIFNGIEVEKFVKKTDFKIKGKLVVASHLRKQKGIQDLIHAMKDLVQHNDIHFTIDVYGDGPYKNNLLQLISEFNLNHYFNFKGSVPNLYEQYANYDFLIHPSHGETFCFSVVESLICNLPVITTINHGNVLELVKEKQNGFLFKAGNTKQLKDILLNYFDQPLLFDNQDIENTFSLDKMVDNYINLML